MTQWTDTLSSRLSGHRLSWRRMRGGSGRLETRRPAGLVGGVARMIDLIFLWQERSRGRYWLAQLDDRTLRDIGLSRIDALREASKPFWRK